MTEEDNKTQEYKTMKIPGLVLCPLSGKLLHNPLLSSGRMKNLFHQVFPVKIQIQANNPVQDELSQAEAKKSLCI